MAAKYVTKRSGWGSKLASRATQRKLAKCVCFCTVLWGSIFISMKWRGCVRSGRPKLAASRSSGTVVSGWALNVPDQFLFDLLYMLGLWGCFGQKAQLLKVNLKATSPFSGTSLGNIYESMTLGADFCFFPGGSSGSLLPVVPCVFGLCSGLRRALNGRE